MRTNLLGDSGITVTRMGLGLAALGRPGYINLGHAADLNRNYGIKAMEAQCHRVLDRAWALGVRYFDAARSYGRAEVFLASWLASRNIMRDQVTVGSKWGYSYTADWQTKADIHEVKEHSAGLLKKQWRESKENLGRWLKLYQIHSATLESAVLENRKVLDGLVRIKSENIAIGLTLSGTKQAETLQKAVEIKINGRPLFDVVQASWNLLETSAGETLKEARRQGVGIIIKEGVANGRLTERNNEQDFSEKKTVLKELARQHHCTIDTIALAYILQQPWVDIVLSGATTVEQLKSNLKAIELKELPEIDISEKADIYWNKRSRLDWN